MGYIKTKDLQSGQPVELYYEDYGQGTPVVLIHGWPMNLQMWEYQTEFLVNNGFRVVAYDRRGFGKSSKPWNGYDYNTFTDDLKAVLDTLDLKDVVLVGFSMGGGEVARYFGRYKGERVAKAVFLAAITPFLLKTNDNQDGVDQTVFDGILNGLKEDRIGFIDDFGKQFFGVNLVSRPVSTPALEYYRNLAAQASLHATLEAAKAFSSSDLRKDLANITVPTLIIHGDADKIVPLEASGNKTAKLLPNAVFKVYDGAPHGLFYTEKDKLNADLLSFLQGKESGFDVKRAGRNL